MAADISEIIGLSSPTVYLRLGESSGITASDEMGNYDFTYRNSPTLGESGLPDDAADADTSVYLASASSQYLDSTYPGVTGASPRTFCAVIKLDSPTSGANQTIISQGAASTGQLVDFMVTTSNKLRVDVNGGYREATSNTLSLSTVYHVACVISDSDIDNIEIYLDGVRVDDYSSASPTISTSSTNKPIIGSKFGSSQFFKGWIDEVALYETALDSMYILTQAEIVTGDHWTGFTGYTKVDGSGIASDVSVFNASTRAFIDSVTSDDGADGWFSIVDKTATSYTRAGTYYVMSAPTSGGAQPLIEGPGAPALFNSYPALRTVSTPYSSTLSASVANDVSTSFSTGSIIVVFGYFGLTVVSANLVGVNHILSQNGAAASNPGCVHIFQTTAASQTFSFLSANGSYLNNASWVKFIEIASTNAAYKIADSSSTNTSTADYSVTGLPSAAVILCHTGDNSGGSTQWNTTPTNFTELYESQIAGTNPELHIWYRSNHDGSSVTIDQTDTTFRAQTVAWLEV